MRGDWPYTAPMISNPDTSTTPAAKAAASEPSWMEDVRTFEATGIARPQAFPVYVLSLLTASSDLAELAGAALTDGPNDKKVDLCYIDCDSGTAYVAQSCLYERWDRDAAEANKASDLATAINWLLKAQIDMVPEDLRPRATELRYALAAGTITRLEILYIHNALASQNVARELHVVAEQARTFIEDERVSIHVREIGRSDIQTLVETAHKDILVTDEVSLRCERCFELKGPSWRAIVTHVNAAELFDLTRRYPDNRLYSRNIRDYLGLRRTKGNINFGIKQTIQAEPANFWPYNNGITILTNRLDVSDGVVRMFGLSIINGAQTTGVLSESTRSELLAVEVPCRIIECRDESAIGKIVQFNNTQNEIKGFDLRSVDQVQTRLKEEFAKYCIQYVHRRSGARRLPPTAIHADSIAPYLCAFHGDLQTAMRNRREIFEDDDKYRDVFDPNVSAEHIYLVQALVDAIDEYKRLLREKKAANELKERDATRLKVLEYSTAKLFVVSVIGKLIEEITGHQVPASINWKCRKSDVRQVAEPLRRAWKVALDALIPRVASYLGDDLYGGVRSPEQAKAVAEKIAVDIESFKTDFDAAFSPLRDITEW